MDELLGFLFERLNGDGQLTDLYRAAGGTPGGRLVIAPHQRTTADYPRIVLSGEEGKARAFADDAPPVLLDSGLTVEIVTRTSAACPKPLRTLRNLQRRVMALLMGDARQNLAPIMGQIVYNPLDVPDDASDSDLLAALVAANAYRWNVTQFRQTDARMLPTTSPDYVRHETTFEVGLYRLR